MELLNRSTPVKTNQNRTTEVLRCWSELPLYRMQNLPPLDRCDCNRFHQFCKFLHLLTGAAKINPICLTFYELQPLATGLLLSEGCGASSPGLCSGGL